MACISGALLPEPPPGNQQASPCALFAAALVDNKIIARMPV
jgi:hypothetical protein